MAVKLSALRAGRRSTPQKHYFSPSGTHFRYRLGEPQGLVRPEGVGKLISKAIPVGGRGGLPGCEKLRITHCSDSRLTDGGKVVSLTRRPRSNSQNIFLLPELIYVIG
jgi:hypothetical protein